MTMITSFFRNVRMIILCVVVVIGVPLTLTAKPRHAQNKQPNSHIISSFWDSIAFWRPAAKTPEMHYLSDAPPPNLQIAKLAEVLRDEEKNADYRMQSLPPRAHFSRTQIPSFSKFLEDINSQPLEEQVDSVDAGIGETVQEEAVAVVTETLPDAAPKEAIHTADEEVDPNASDIEAVFPMPYEQLVSGGRLLMFYPLDGAVSNNDGAPTLMLPINPLLDFQPPNNHPGRSSATYTEGQ